MKKNGQKRNAAETEEEKQKYSMLRHSRTHIDEIRATDLSLEFIH